MHKKDDQSARRYRKTVVVVVAMRFFWSKRTSVYVFVTQPFLVKNMLILYVYDARKTVQTEKGTKYKNTFPADSCEVLQHSGLLGVYNDVVKHRDLH